MNKYVSHKEVQAEPMTMKEADEQGLVRDYINSQEEC